MPIIWWDVGKTHSNYVSRIFKYTLRTLKVSFKRVKTRLKIAFISVVKKKKRK